MPSPARAGTITTPPESGTLLASGSMSLDLSIIPRPSRNHPTSAPAPQSYCLEGSVFVAGALVGWLRDGLGIIERSSDIEPLARSVPDSGGVVIVPALAGLGTPHWDPFARGLIVGLTRSTERSHIARAALNAIALSVAEVLGCLEASSGHRLPRLRVDGGACVNDLLMQTQADVLGVPIDRPAVL